MRKSSTRHFVLVSIILIALPILGAAGPEAPQNIPPKMIEINSLLEADKELLDDLQVSLKAATNEIEALRLLQAIHQQKQDTEISLLRIQERYAREAGDTATADKIKREVEKILNPPVPVPNTQAREESAARTGGGSHHE